MATQNPNSKNRGERDSVFIVVNEGGVRFNYGWSIPKRLKGLAQGLGIKDASTATGPVLTGVNSPKPRRARRVTDTAILQTFVDDESIDGARKKGWKISRSLTKRGLGSSARTRSVMVPWTEVGANIYYAWRMNVRDFTTYGTALGIEVANEAGKILIWGADQKPARASKTLPDGSTVSAFCDSGKEAELLNDGWSVQASTASN